MSMPNHLARCTEVAASDFQFWRSSAIELMLQSVRSVNPFGLVDIIQAARAGNRVASLHAAADSALFAEATRLLVRQMARAIDPQRASGNGDAVAGVEGLVKRADAMFDQQRFRAALMCYSLGLLCSAREDQTSRWAEVGVARCLARGYRRNNAFVDWHKARQPELFKFAD